ncbi:transcriptional regulator SIN3 [Lachancea thermotolerans CBS 6340]|uniref:KLTH0C10956p n=1 Tax=Lachancea thermotolerans (strain ATCC 56472 / CBS 6340 / NRRL Y-8284) TaxID=559295 RepID=C5DEP6_LACTC|nr:KLTH0C10956p [Lachancea thermotolerans CBS 6340]CAR22257.1 KLTH0C10956p [Lachancea thermotolerans CBS 6340]
MPPSWTNQPASQTGTKSSVESPSLSEQQPVSGGMQGQAANSTGESKANAPVDASQQPHQFVLPSLSGLDAGTRAEYGSEPQRLPSLQGAQPQSISSGGSKGFSVASLNNPLPAQQQMLHSQQQQQLLQQGVLPLEHVQDPSYRPLNFKDALSYLEQVKFQFNNRPDVYNHFLDIMKDYKSQAIDTLGVIERISTLFKGYPILIQGLNTFLPQGYKIECTLNPNDPHSIKVTTPFDNARELNLATMATGNGIVEGHPSLMPSDDVSPPKLVGHEPAAVQPKLENAPTNLPVPTTFNQNLPQHEQQNQQHGSQSPAMPQQQRQDQQFMGNRPSGDVEFSHAISYVNKIKTRFADQPEIYKHFLEILQTYQREQKPIHEVYAQVTSLFQNAPDLLDDFKKFLPDATAAHEQQQLLLQQQQQQQQQLQQQQIQQHQSHYQNASQDLDQRQQHTHQPFGNTVPFYQTQQGRPQNLPPLGSFSPPINGRENDPQLNLPAVQPPAMEFASQQVPHHPSHVVPQVIPGGTLPLSDLRGAMDGNFAPQPLQSQDVQFIEPTSRPEIDLDPSLVPVIPEPIKPLENDLTLIEETSFFDRAKKYMGNKQVYTEFLKILNLFSQDLIGTEELVDKVEHYLGGSPELFDWFKSFVNYVEKPKHIENVIHEKHRLDLDLCEACFPSYKKLPKADTFMPCSGRDEMCWEVLNDEWVGHPVWASEDSGFIAHRKNQYEETLFKIEEERHEYDYYIEANLRTIQLLETIANKISNMTPEEKQAFKLPPGLGHTSMTIYKKVIRKVYDKDRGFEIIDALHENPAVSVPIILKRLKQKDEEWRRAQREWNKVWRELEQKVFYKSLDHLGLTFKQADKKLLTAKQLISEISSIKVDQTNKRIYPFTPKPKSQLDYDLKDKGVLFDILCLVNNFIDHSSTYSNPDKEKLAAFFKGFLSVFFSISYQEIENSTPADSDAVSNSNPRKRLWESEQPLKELLRSKHKHHKKRDTSAEDDSISDDQNSPEKSPQEIEDEEVIRQEAKKPWLLGNILDEANDHGYVSNRKIFNLFANTNVYVFFRHLTTMYQRLSEVKNMNEEVTREINSRNVVQFAKDLNLVSTQLSDMGLDFKGKDAYDQLLTLCKRLIRNDMDHQWFEESLRQAYKNKAFKIYTVDKVIQSLVKHAHSIITDAKSAEIMILFEKDRRCTATSTKEQILYRLQVRSYMGLTENMFRVEINKDSCHVCIQYVAIDDLTLKEPESLKDRWHYYLTSYALSHPTEGIPHEEIKVPFLEKTLQDDEEADEGSEERSPSGHSLSNLRIQVNPESYELQIEPGSKDIFTRFAVNRFLNSSENNSNTDLKEEKRKTLMSQLDGSRGWKKGMSQELVDKTLTALNYVRLHGKHESLNKNPALVQGTRDPRHESSVAKEASSLESHADDTELKAGETTAEDIQGNE